MCANLPSEYFELCIYVYICIYVLLQPDNLASDAKAQASSFYYTVYKQEFQKLQNSLEANRYIATTCNE